ncbi:uncharacterized protein LOC111385187 isoform X1 [Olea europaea var. sylvestris]|uniref:uncharacterized protein LOC111385187 isoform X1 n=1 Tax=Olea europaea var. sylvestris TaxID=158386 RepID=UPI000C1D3C0F|nr:uncharacterized protein LOC111385187 isoform X1 [Olea europaea var. sylvestris]
MTISFRMTKTVVVKSISCSGEESETVVFNLMNQRRAMPMTLEIDVSFSLRMNCGDLARQTTSSPGFFNGSKKKRVMWRRLKLKSIKQGFVFAKRREKHWLRNSLQFHFSSLSYLKVYINRDGIARTKSFPELVYVIRYGRMASRNWQKKNIYKI